MSFFNSDVVRSEIAEIADLQEEVYTNVFNFSKMNKESQLNHVHLLQRLLEKQRVLYTRLSLSDDPEAVEMKERIAESATMMGLAPGTDMSIIFKNMSDLIEVMRQQIDKTEFDQ